MHPTMQQDQVRCKAMAHFMRSQVANPLLHHSDFIFASANFFGGGAMPSTSEWHVHLLEAGLRNTKGDAHWSIDAY